MAIKSKEPRAKSKEPRAKSLKLYTVHSMLYALCSILLFFGGCASLSQREAVLAVVDGEPVTEEDLKYALNIAHRREDLSSAGALNLSQYVQKLIDDRLIIHEARNAGIDQYPEVKQAIEAYILRESVVRLHNEEIVQKVFITEEEIKGYYFKVKGEEAPDEEFEKVKGSLQKAIRKQKEKERSDEYLKYLREKVNIKIDKELLSAINMSGSKEERQELMKDERPVAEVNSSILTVGEFMGMLTSSTKRSNEEIVNSWIERKLVDHEALSRHYEMKPDLKNMVYRYENQFLKNTFIKRIILPRIVVNDKNLEEYYAAHQQSFIKPIRYKIQQITVKSRDGAQKILDSLNKGADFSWLAKRKPTDSAAQEGGDAGWFTKAELPEPLREIIDSMKAGNTSPIIEIESRYGIVKLIDKTGEEVEEFDKVKNAVYKAYFNEQVNALLDKYINQLKTGAQIKIYEDEIRLFEDKFK